MQMGAETGENEFKINYQKMRSRRIYVGLD